MTSAMGLTIRTGSVSAVAAAGHRCDALPWRRSAGRARHRSPDLLRFELWPLRLVTNAYLSELTFAAFRPGPRRAGPAREPGRAVRVRERWPAAGLDNFRADAEGPDLAGSFAHTFVLVAVILVVNIAGGTLAALSMRRDSWAVRATLGLMVFVWALPAVVVGNLWRFLLTRDGPVNAVLTRLHVGAQPGPWLRPRPPP